MTNLSVRFWNRVRKLTTTTGTLLSEVTDTALDTVQLDDSNNQQNTEVIIVQQIDSVESVDKYKICGHCSKRLIQAQGIIVKCDHCSQRMRASLCPTKVSASVVVRIENSDRYLFITNEVLHQLLGLYDLDTVETNDLTEKLLLLDDVTIHYINSKVTSIEAKNSCVYLKLTNICFCSVTFVLKNF